MGGGGEKKKTNQMLDTQYNAAMNDAARFNNTAYTQQGGAINAANNMQQSAYNTLNTMSSTGGMDPAMRQMYLDSLKSSGGGPDMSGYNKVQGLYNQFANGGGVDAGAVRAAMAASREIAGSGGWSQADRDAVMGDVNALRQIGQTGGLDADAINRMRGGGVFQQFQQNGGYTPDQVQDLRARAISPLGSYYDAVRTGNNQMASIQGGNPLASQAMALRTARDQASAMRDASLNAELGIQDKIRQGQQWGATSGASAENALQSLRTGNMMSALNSAANQQGNMLNSIAGNRLTGSNQWTQGEEGLQSLIQAGKEFGIKGLESVAGARASASSAGRGDMTRGLQWLADFEAGNRLNAAGEMTNLYSATPGEVNMWNNDLLQQQAQRAGAVGNVVDQRMQNNPNRNWLDTIGGLAGSFAGAATGLGALGLGRGASSGARVSAPTMYGRPY